MTPAPASSPTAHGRKRWPSWKMPSRGLGHRCSGMEHVLHPWVAFAIIPLFALANAGVRVEGDLGAALGNRVTLGVVLGLVLGKQLGVTLAAWLAVRSGVTDLPEGVGWRHIYGAGWLAGIGFTMSLFVADLAFASGRGRALDRGEAGHPRRLAHRRCRRVAHPPPRFVYTAPLTGPAWPRGAAYPLPARLTGWDCQLAVPLFCRVRRQTARSRGEGHVGTHDCHDHLPGHLRGDHQRAPRPHGGGAGRRRLDDRLWHPRPAPGAGGDRPQHDRAPRRHDDHRQRAQAHRHLPLRRLAHGHCPGGRPLAHDDRLRPVHRRSPRPSSTT